MEAKIRQLSNTDVKGTDPKYKSQWGGSMDIFVMERVKWPHDFVLAGSTKDRITYNQLNITHWMSGPVFTKILILRISLILRIFLRLVVFLRKILRIRIFLFTKIFILRIMHILRIFLRMVFIVRIFVRIRICYS